MKLTLDHRQRINLCGLIGAQRGSVDEIRGFWRLQDQFALTEDEKQTIGYRIAAQNGMEMPTWNSQAKLSPRDFDLNEADQQRLQKILKEWPHFMAGVDRDWLTPILEQIEPK